MDHYFLRGIGFCSRMCEVFATGPLDFFVHVLHCGELIIIVAYVCGVCDGTLKCEEIIIVVTHTRRLQ